MAADATSRDEQDTLGMEGLGMKQKWTQLAEIETLSGRRNKKTGELESYIIKRSNTGKLGCNCFGWIFSPMVDGAKPDCKHIEFWRETKRTVPLSKYVNGEAMDDLTKVDYGWMWDVINAHFAVSNGQEKLKSKCLRWLKTKLDTPLEQATPIQPQLDFRIKRMITLEE